jgi:dTDP-4-dehydrorhamnose reductase
MGRSSLPILIVGQGTVGSAIAVAAGERAIKAARAPIANDTIPFDAMTDDIAPILLRMAPLPKAVVIAFGISGTHTCASNPIGSRELNVDRVLAAATAITKCGSLPVLLSTDSVFDGSSTVWSEDDSPNPNCEYGRQKLATERAIAKLGIPYLMMRLSRVVADHAHRRDLLYQWCDLMSRGETIQLPTDQIFTPIAAADLGPIAVSLIDSDVRGLINVAGPEQVSAPALFHLLNSACNSLGVELQFNQELCRVSDLPGLEVRPASTLLSTRRLERIISPNFTPLVESVYCVASAVFASDKSGRCANIPCPQSA